MKKWKKNLIAVALLATVCGGIFVNWRYTKDKNAVNLTDTLDADKILSADMLVMSDNTSLEANGVNTTSDYFAAVRLSRQEARDNAVTLLQEAMAYSDDTQSAQSNAQLEEIVQTALCEAVLTRRTVCRQGFLSRARHSIVCPARAGADT